VDLDEMLKEFLAKLGLERVIDIGAAEELWMKCKIITHSNKEQA